MMNVEFKIQNPKLEYVSQAVGEFNVVIFYALGGFVVVPDVELDGC